MRSEGVHGRLALALVVALLFLLGLEGTARAYVRVCSVALPREEETPWYLRAFVGALRDPARFWGPAPGARAPGEVRLLFLGDSVTAGYGLKEGEHPFPELLEARLAGELPGDTRLRVYNRALLGATSTQGRILLEEGAPRLKPTVVVAGFLVNDASPAAAPDSYYLEGGWVREVALLLHHLDSYLLLRQWLLGSPEKPNPSRWTLRAPPEEYRRNLRRIVQRARALGARPLLLWLALAPGSVLMPHGVDAGRVGSYEGALEEVVEETGAAFLDLEALFQKAGSASELFLPHDSIHPNARGHRLIASALLDFLRRQGMVPGKAR